MKKIYFSLFVVASFVTFTLTEAHAQALQATLKFGLSMGHTSEPQPVLIVTPYQNYKNCFAVGTGSLSGDRLQVSLQTMTCGDDHYFYQFDVTDAVVSDGTGNKGIQAKHYPPSKELLDSVKGLKDLYGRIGYSEGLKLISNAEMGHWVVEPGTHVLVNFHGQSGFTRKISVHD
ncbi:MAG: hypothetical protein RBT37_01660 [Dissulfurispiraceae bacterium]|jgi:hypothetical protein|nr:hypothetical protein [Dissulfurispiraceae bacterium]